MLNVQAEAERIACRILKSGSPLARYVLPDKVPVPFEGTGPIRLVVLGQDPTVKNAKSRKRIRTVLNLDVAGSLRSYLDRVCQGLGIRLAQHVYATNVLKCFFTQPPTTIQIAGLDVFEEAARFWLPLLKKELAQFPGVPILTLGEPVLTVLVRPPSSQRVRDCWGYTPEWKQGDRVPFRHVPAEESVLDRPFFPFPHQPSLAKRFYQERLSDYIAYVKG